MKSKSVLVSGGAGYIGSHMVQMLVERGLNVVVIDKLVTGHRAAVSQDAVFYDGDISDSELVGRIVRDHGIDAVIHFAARSLVGESVLKPDLYFLENTAKTNQFVSTLVHAGVKKIVFSSTAAVYGIPETVPIPEDTKKEPINPYGHSKRMVEQSLECMGQAYGLQWVALRYFNACGASFDGSIGEHHDPETHLIPLILQAALGQRESAAIYGTDYNTPDGTCIRDYIHVLDLAHAHMLALEALDNGLASGAFNVGTGQGYSVRQVIEAAKRVTECEFPVIEGPRRAGDPDSLVAKVDKIQKELGFQAQYSDLDTILKTAWNWHKNNPTGYSR